VLTTLRYFSTCTWVAETPTVCSGPSYWTLTYDGTTIKLTHTSLTNFFEQTLSSWNCDDTRLLGWLGGTNTMCKTPPASITITPV
jgi:hypothetical protein